MKTLSFYSFNDYKNDVLNLCSNDSGSLPLVVNCCGNIYSEQPFVTHNKKGRDDYYLMYIISGELAVYVDDKSTVVGVGSLLIFPPHFKYRYTYDGTKPLSYYWVHFSGSDVCKIMGELKINFFPLIYRITSENHLEQRFRNMFDAFSNNDEYRDRELNALLERLLVSIARSIKTNEKKEDILSSIRYINYSYSDDIKIPFLAEMEHLSVSRYNVIFKKITGMSPMKYILRLRMSSACDLLRNTDLSIKQIGNMCGYNDSHFFSKIFKKHIGVSPMEFRRGI